jgi:hypothetical protein
MKTATIPKTPSQTGTNAFAFGARWLAPAAPTIALLVFLGATVAILWILFWHEAALQRNHLLRDVQAMEVTLTRELLADQQFADRLAFELADRKDANAYFALQTEEYLRVRPAIANISWNAADNGAPTPTLCASGRAWKS